MYIQGIFAETDKHVLSEFIKAVNFGALIIQGGDKIEVNHIPFEYVEEEDGCGLLRGHVSRKNPCIDLARENENVTVVFTGPNAYISPRWMPGHKTHRKVAPSWNYSAVHIYGKAKIIEDSQWISNHIHSLTENIESKRSDPWSISEADPDFVEKMPKYITGVEISVVEIQGKFQASQQYSERTRSSIKEALVNERGDIGKSVQKMISERNENNC